MSKTGNLNFSLTKKCWVKILTDRMGYRNQFDPSNDDRNTWKIETWNVRGISAEEQ